MAIRRLIIGASLGLGLAMANLGANAAEEGNLKDVGEFSIPDWFKVSFLDLTADVRDAAQADKRLLLVWYQDGCPYCARLINTNFSQKRIADYTREHFDVIALNLWGSRQVTNLTGETLSEKALAKERGVQFTPTLQFLDESGEVVLRLNGYYPPREFMTALRYVGEGKEDQLNFGRYLKQATDKKAEGGGLTDHSYLAEPPHRLAASDEPVAVIFEQADCRDCARLHENMLAEPKARKLLGDFRVVQLDRWSDTPVVTPAGKKTDAESWAEQLQLRYLPALVLFDGDREVIRMESLLRGFHVRSMLAYVASQAYRETPQFQDYIQQRSERLRDKGVTVDLWEEN
ncbi:thioredoxin family protein [Thiohalorhabdus sp.]|uniref:thioredoxin family protein n=1 Tax=Thiohalorhabdus sp. TaxID=3094134 RepID=UPI002FC32DCD